MIAIRKGFGPIVTFYICFEKEKRTSERNMEVKSIFLCYWLNIVLGSRYLFKQLSSCPTGSTGPAVWLLVTRGRKENQGRKHEQ